jgi:hypothetical protein
MSDLAAIRATFSDFKVVRGRKVAQLVFETPIEEADAALVTLGGLPNPASERWVAIALLVPEAAERGAQIAKDRRPFASLPYSQQAALKCSDPDFQRFLKVKTSEAAAEIVRDRCHVQSRSEIGQTEYTKACWLEMLREYGQWAGPH